LAVIQTKITADALREKIPGLEIDIKTITTRGDSDRTTTLWKLTTTGFFTSQLEEALLNNQAHIAIHSFKDLPTQMHPGLIVAAVCDRQFSEDCLIAAKKIKTINDLPKSATVGTSSLRRLVQVKRLRDDLKVETVRGNVPTRIRKVDEGEYDAIILARAGIERLGLNNRISLCFDPADFIPAPAQGALALQTREDDQEVNDIVSNVNDDKARIVCLAERQILVTTKCGCHAPVGAFAKIENNKIEIIAFIADQTGDRFISKQMVGPVDDYLKIAEKLANELLNSGGKEILENLKNE
ncbi:MAG: hydroxymethylbilane synthase, partial [Planctomycetota bacterium]